eukprot:1455854-Amphidinium_carterae.1
MACRLSSAGSTQAKSCPLSTLVALQKGDGSSLCLDMHIFSSPLLAVVCTASLDCSEKVRPPPYREAA